MEEKSHTPKASRRRRRIITTLLPLILVLVADAAAGTQVYRCATPDGKIEFLQHACSDGTEAHEITIEDRETGWDPSQVQVEQSDEDGTKSSRRKRKSEKASAATRARQDEKCWSKQKSLEEVNRKLRRGYKRGAGEKLRRRRQNYEEYISRFCE